MDYQDYITVKAERKKGQHLGAEERGAIKVLVKQGLGIRAIARAIGCAPSTVTNELQRGTPPRKSSRGKPPGYSPALGEAVYKANRSVCRKPLKAKSCKAFIVWVVEQVREHKWSLDSCYGYAREHRLYHENEMVCTCTLYNMVWAGLLPITPTELPEALKRKAKNHKAREHKRKYGQSISNRPEIAALRIEEGHWEGDTVVGKRAGNEAVVLSLLEKKTETYLALRIPAKTSEAVMEATSQRFLRPLLWITVVSSLTLRRWKPGGLRSTSPIRIPLGNVHRMSVTTAYSELSFPKECPLSSTQMRTSLPLLTS